ncbi:MAG: TatD family hydrolase [Vicinamibacterales bacterium]
MIDSHCHLADDVFASDLPDVLTRTKEAGFERVMVILEAGNAKEEAQAKKAYTLWNEIRVAIGVHPHHAQQFNGNALGAVEKVREQIKRTPYTRAVGEIGLDYHYDYSPRPTQQAVFRAQLRLARELKLPVVIHTREADSDTIDALKSAGGGEVRGVLHCFTGTRELASAALDLGFYISLAGVLTFPNAQDLRNIARQIPMDRLLLETDSPFLTPAPHRGARNEPARMLHTAETLAALKGVSVAELGTVTTANFHALFRP